MAISFSMGWGGLVFCGFVAMAIYGVPRHPVQQHPVKYIW
jgi:hypothetical protein